jgi:hypothetical protein
MGLSDLINKLKQNGSRTGAWGAVVRPWNNVLSSTEIACLVSGPACLVVTEKICSYKANLASINILFTEAFLLLRCYALVFVNSLSVPSSGVNQSKERVILLDPSRWDG